MKEWNGNKKSVRVMNGDAHNPDRAEADYYTTDPAAVEEFLELAFPSYCNTFKHPYVVWEPACGCGNISKVLKKRFEKVISTDLYDRGYGDNYFTLKNGQKVHQPIDFLQTTSLPDPYIKMIITNPQYSLSDEFIQHALDLLPEDGDYIALLNINYLAGKKRFETIYKNGYLQQVYIYTHRINCYKNNQPTGHSSPVNYGWFCFSKQPDWQHKKMNKLGFKQTAPTIHWI